MFRTFVEAQDSNSKELMIIFPLHSLFLICISAFVGKLVGEITDKKLNHYGDPYNRILELMVNSQVDPNQIHSHTHTEVLSDNIYASGTSRVSAHK